MRLSFVIYAKTSKSHYRNSIYGILQQGNLPKHSRTVTETIVDNYTHIVELSGESPRPHSGGVGLEHSIHRGHVSRGNPQPSAHAPRSAVGRGHIWIGTCKREKLAHALAH